MQCHSAIMEYALRWGGASLSRFRNGKENGIHYLGLRFRVSGMKQNGNHTFVSYFFKPKVLGVSRKVFRFQQKENGTTILLETIWGLEERSISRESSKAGLGTCKEDLINARYIDCETSACISWRTREP